MYTHALYVDAIYELQLCCFPRNVTGEVANPHTSFFQKVTKGQKSPASGSFFEWMNRSRKSQLNSRLPSRQGTVNGRPPQNNTKTDEQQLLLLLFVLDYWNLFFGWPLNCSGRTRILITVKVYILPAASKENAFKSFENLLGPACVIGWWICARGVVFLPFLKRHSLIYSLFCVTTSELLKPYMQPISDYHSLLLLL